MSDTQQGEGWWLASDGKWYPPEAQPGGPPVSGPDSTEGVPAAAVAPGIDPGPTAAPSGYGAPPAYGGPPGYGAPPAYGPAPGYPMAMSPQKTNGLAIAALILSIVWLGGLGSVAAVVLGIVSLNQISKAKGALGGKGLSIAALIIGGIGVLLTVLFYAAVVFTVGVVSHLAQSATVPVGTTITVKNNSINYGISSIVVDQVTSSSTGNGGVVPDNGKQFAFAHVKICATSQGTSNYFGASLFTVNSSDGSSDIASTTGARSPSLSEVNSIAGNQCVSGWLTFQISSSATAKSVNYYALPFTDFTWTVSG